MEDIGTLKLCWLFCSTVCPPTPVHITNKLAFHPPPRKSTHRLIFEDGTVAKSAKECFNKPYRFEWRSKQNPVQWLSLPKRAQPFTVKVSKSIYLSCIKIKPTMYSVSPTVNRHVIIFSQPNLMDLGGYLGGSNEGSLLDITNRLLVDVYAYDYPGFGYSTGGPNEQDAYLALEKLYTYVRELNPDKQIVLLGYSIGTAISTHVAHLQPPGLAGLVLVAPFTSGMRLYFKKPLRAKKYYLDSFESIDKVTKVNVPTVIIHGTHDEVVSPEHGQALQAALGHFSVPPLFIYGANHQDIFMPRRRQIFVRIVNSGQPSKIPDLHWSHKDIGKECYDFEAWWHLCAYESFMANETRLPKSAKSPKSKTEPLSSTKNQGASKSDSFNDETSHFMESTQALESQESLTSSSQSTEASSSGIDQSI